MDRLAQMGKPTWIRHVVVPGYTADETRLRDVARWIGQYTSVVERVELLPYHTLGTYKYEELGIPYPLEGVPALSQEEITRARSIFRELLPDIPVG